MSEKIIASLEKISQKAALQPVVMLAEVLQRNDADCTVGVRAANELEYYDVRLRPTVSDKNKVVILPKIGSYVLMQSIGNSADWVIISVEQAEEIVIEIDTLTLDIDTITGKADKVDVECDDIKINANGINISCNDVVFNNGVNAGLVKIRQLETNLNLIKTTLNALNAAISAGFVACLPIPGGPPPASTYMGAAVPAMATLQYVPMENSKIKH
jgi:hypothetical protein